MELMFQGNYYLETIIIHSFDTSKVTCIDHMFKQNSYITSLDLSNFVITNVKEMGSVFEGNYGLYFKY